MFGAIAIATLAATASASGHGGEQLNQLETARLVQPAQRVEFGVEGEDSAFKFRFSDPVRSEPALAYCRALLQELPSSGRRARTAQLQPYVR